MSSILLNAPQLTNDTHTCMLLLIMMRDSNLAGSISGMVWDWPIMLIFYPLCYAAVLKILAYYAQYYAQEQELCSAHYTNYIQVCHYISQIILGRLL